MSADDWSDACDPVPVRRPADLTDAQRADRLKRLKKRQHLAPKLNKDSVPGWVENDFDEMGA